MLFIGRRRGWPVAREGAQKLKEISYIHAEAYASAELKHGPLALVSPELPTDRGRARRRPVRQEHLDAGRDQGPPGPGDRGGAPRAAGRPGRPHDRRPEAEDELDPILISVPLQILAYHAAVALERDVDKPRNLAKSVTVE